MTTTRGSSDIRQQIKRCPVCQRDFHNRKKWQQRGVWEQIVYCSKRCRSEASSRMPGTG